MFPFFRKLPKTSYEDALLFLAPQKRLPLYLTKKLQSKRLKPGLRGSVRYRSRTELCNNGVLGRTLLKVEISTYRDFEHIKEAFKHMKNRNYLRWKTAVH